MTEPSAFYMWIGKCIKRWAGIEDQLFSICQWALQIDRKLTSIVFFRTPTLESRLTLTSDLMQARLLLTKKNPGEHDPPLLKKFGCLMERIRERLAFRNALVS